MFQEGAKYKRSVQRKRPSNDGLSIEIEIEKDEQQKLESKPHLDRMTQQVQNLFKFKNFYDQMDFDASGSLEITKAIIEQTNFSRGSGLFQSRPHGGGRFEDSHGFL